jgi:multimeric flavodoxin WrbA
MKALVINCTLKPSPEKSNTEALAEIVADALRKEGIEVSSVRAVDHQIPPGVESEMGEGDEWPTIRAQILDAEILVFATPTWLGRPSSVSQRVLERMDAMLSETDDEERPVAYNRVTEANPIPAPPSE